MEKETIKVAGFLTEKEHEAFRIYCFKHKISMAQFIKHSIIYCMKNDITPK
jgi:hypothetical protein